MAKKFNNTMRYIDDLLTLNNRRFEKEIEDIHVYPHELKRKKTTESPTTLSYLDILITIDNGTYSTTVFDKWDTFTFDIVNYMYHVLSSNIPAKSAYGVYISQFVRIGRICSNFVQFTERHYKLTQNRIKLGFWYSGLYAIFKKFAWNHVSIFFKYGHSVRNTLRKGYVYRSVMPQYVYVHSPCLTFLTLCYVSL